MTLILVDADDTQVVRRVPQGEARREAALRDLIADSPEILPVHDLDPSYGRLITVTKELSIPGVGFVDILPMDEHGRLVVVECKLWRNYYHVRLMLFQCGSDVAAVQRQRYKLGGFFAKGARLFDGPARD